MNRRNVVVFFLSLVMLIISLLVIYLLWTIKEAKKIECVYESLKGDILNYPSNNDSNVVIKHGKEYYDREEEPKDVIIYEYKEYKITFLEDNNLSNLTIRNANNEMLYSNKTIKLSIYETVCNNGNYTNTRNYSVKPIISNGKLYFVSLSKECYLFKNNERKPYFEYNYIDLNSNNLIVKNIQEMKLKIDNYYGCEY